MVALLVVVVLGQSSPMGGRAPGRLTVNEQPAPTPPPASDDDWAGTRPGSKPLQREVRRPASTEPERWSAGATKRFVGALLGGAIGAALPLTPGALATNGCPTLAPCPGWGLVAGIAAPLLSVLGASLGYSLMGGEPSVGAALAGLIGGLAAAAALSLLDLALSTQPTSRPRWPAIVAASGLALSFSVLAMEARSDALDRAPFIASPASRIVLTALALVGTLGIEALVVGLLASTFGGGVLAAVIVVASLGLTPLVPIAVHRALDGKGSFGAGYLGWAASLAVAGIAVVGIAATSSSLFSGDPALISILAISITCGSLAAALGVPLFLEWSHGNALIEESENAPAVKAQLSFAPVVGPTGLTGGALALTGTF
ncbi:MAG: hypothetical protein Q8L14_40160 [Myxococcales bacterium]|nr:hypothetical protein [Myxococcales bacterium]